MDGAQCLVAENGDVSIGPHKIHRLFFRASAGAGLLWVVCLVLGFTAPSGISSPPFPWTWIEGSFALGAALLAIAGILLLWSLGQRKKRILVKTRRIEWTHGFRTRRYPFGGVSHIGILFYKIIDLSVHRTYMLRTAKQIVEIELALADGGWITLAKFSGGKAGIRALDIAQLVAAAIGVPVRKITNS